MDNNHRPLYRIYIDPDENLGELQLNSAVEIPANDKKFFAFKDEKYFKFNDSEQTIVGVAIVPNKRIYRNMPDMGEFDVYFSVDDIKTMVVHYGKSLNWNKITMSHDMNKPITSAVMTYSYIINEEVGLTAPEMFADEPNGTWIIGYKFEDKKEYEYVRDNFTGWSVEGEFLLQAVSEFKSKIQNKMSKEKMTVKDYIKSLFSVKKAKFGEATLEDGNVVVWEGDELVPNETAVFLVTEDGETPAPDGSHTTTEGVVIVTEGGIVQEVVEAEMGNKKDEEDAGEFDASAEIKSLKETVANIQKQLEENGAVNVEEFAKKETFEAEQKTISEKFEELEKANKELAEKVEELSKKASAQPTKKKAVFKATPNEKLSPLELKAKAALKNSQI